MQFTVTRGLSDVRRRPYPVATIGNFDGHHRGHRTLLQTVVETARTAKGTAIVLTFDPHPVRVLAPHVDLRFLTSPEEKLARFEAAGVDEVVFLEFTPALAALAPEQFAESVLHRHLNIAEIFVGEHFAFGKGRAGRIADLVRFGARHTDRFKVLVSHDGVFDLRSMYGETEELWFPEWELKAVPWKDPSLYEKWSPSHYIQNAKTPMLIFQGNRDYRVPEGQSFQLFTALQRQGVPSKLVYLEEESHLVLKPLDSRFWYETVQNWLAKYLK